MSTFIKNLISSFIREPSPFTDVIFIRYISIPFNSFMYLIALENIFPDILHTRMSFESCWQNLPSYILQGLQGRLVAFDDWHISFLKCFEIIFVAIWSHLGAANLSLFTYQFSKGVKPLNSLSTVFVLEKMKSTLLLSSRNMSCPIFVEHLQRAILVDTCIYIIVYSAGIEIGSNVRA